jgi:hypothetical protein
MHRPLAASCAACLVTAALYPLEVSRTARQLGKPFPAWTSPNITAGVGPAVVASFATSHAYFAAYERVLQHMPPSPIAVALSSTAALLVSTVVHTPLDIIKKRVQFRRHGMVENHAVKRISSRVVLCMYALHLARTVPKTAIKYTLYEALLRHCAVIGLPQGVAGLVAGASAAGVTTLLCMPLEAAKLRALTRARPLWFSGARTALTYSVLSNGAGHALLEWWAPRGC